MKHTYFEKWYILPIEIIEQFTPKNGGLRLKGHPPWPWRAFGEGSPGR